jgi:hypothetical protein
MLAGMSLWRRLWGDDEARPEGMSDMQRLEQLLLRVADDIAADESNSFLDWSRQMREAAGLVGAGNPRGLDTFFRLCDPDPRNTFNEQPFTWTSTFREASRLASKLLSEHEDDERRRRAAKRDVALRPWRAGSTGKAVVYADGTVITSEDDARGEPRFEDIGDARQRRSPVALVGIRADGSCEAHRNLRDEQWLAAKLRDHDQLLRLGPM